jgi:hypothetical protein
MRENSYSSIKQNYIPGMVMLLAGCVGFIAGLVPFCVALIQLWARVRKMETSFLFTWLDHGARVMGLSLEWVLLSSTAGMVLGIFLIWSGIGWIKNYRWAPVITFAYVTGAICINAVDLIIFFLLAKPCVIRDMMIILDLLAFSFPIVIVLWLFLFQPDVRMKN